jgi:hypothetical protein
LARIREKLKGLKKDSQEYWNRLLTAEGCSMEAGRHPNLIYVGGGATLEGIEGEFRMKSGRVKPKPRAE